MSYQSTLINYESTILHQDIIIDYLISVHYFEYNCDFHFNGEAHDFWEFLYVDKGEVKVTAENSTFVLRKGDIIFHKPMEFHNLWANGVTAPNLIVVAFECNSPAMDFFKNKILRVSDLESNLLAQIIKEAYASYKTPLDDPYLAKLERRESVEFGSEQLIKISLEQMLIFLIRKGKENPNKNTIKPTSLIREKKDSDTLKKIVIYLEDNVGKNITLNDVCTNNYIGRSKLQKMFRIKTGGGVMEYFYNLKIEAAKQLIREGTYNFTEISNKLGFTSIHYFSRRFKTITGMTPTEYASSVKIKLENHKSNIDD